MQARILIAALVGVALVGSGLWFALNRPANNPVQVRDETAVTVNGIRETWQLVWDETPGEVCGPMEVSSAVTCPCSGFAYGESGKMSLVRRRAGQVVERLDVGPFFDGQDHPGDLGPGTAYVGRWPMVRDDIKRDLDEDPVTLANDIRRRPVRKIFEFADYDHDGLAAEFLLQVGTVPCMKHEFVAVGVSKCDGRLHALRSAAHSEKPLVLFREVWDALREGGGTVVTWECQDHGAEFHNETVVSAQDGVIQAKRQTFTCPTGGEERTLTEETDL